MGANPRRRRSRSAAWLGNPSQLHHSEATAANASPGGSTCARPPLLPTRAADRNQDAGGGPRERGTTEEEIKKKKGKKKRRKKKIERKEPALSRGESCIVCRGRSRLAQPQPMAGHSESLLFKCSIWCSGAKRPPPPRAAPSKTSKDTDLVQPPPLD